MKMSGRDGGILQDALVSRAKVESIVTYLDRVATRAKALDSGGVFGNSSGVFSVASSGVNP